MKIKEYKKLIEHLKLDSINFLDFSEKVLAAASEAFEAEQEARDIYVSDCVDLGIEPKLESFDYEPLSDLRGAHRLLQGLREIFYEA